MEPSHSEPEELPLTADMLLFGYTHGCFPMGNEEGLVHWYDPDPRAIFPLESTRPNARFKRFLRNSGFNCSVDTAYERVMRNCATAHGDTWITEKMILAYTQLHRMGHAHSVETWAGQVLVGGIYGVSVGGAFFGESMFSLVPNASKIAFHHLAEHLRQRGFQLFDTQYLNNHTASLGAIEVPKTEFSTMLADALVQQVQF